MGRPDEGIVAQAIISLAHNLKLKVVGEGVETGQVRIPGRGTPATRQGYHFGRADAGAGLRALRGELVLTRTAWSGLDHAVPALNEAEIEGNASIRARDACPWKPGEECGDMLNLHRRNLFGHEFSGMTTSSISISSLCPTSRWRMVGGWYTHDPRRGEQNHDLVLELDPTLEHIDELEGGVV